MTATPPIEALAQSLLQEARQAHQTGQLDRAELLYREVMSAQPDEALAHLGLAFVLTQTGRSDTALALAREATRRFRQHGELFNLLGHLYSQNGQNDRATASFRRAVKVSPELGLAWFNLGMMEVGRGHLPAAIAALQQAAARLPQNPDVAHELASAHARTGDLDAAELVLTRSLGHHPRHAATFDLMGRLYRLRDAHDKAAALLETALSLGHRTALSLAMLGDCYRSQMRYHQALECYQASLSLDAEAQRVRFMVGEMQQQLGQHELALLTYQTIRADGDAELAAELQVSLALALSRAGRPLEAEALLVQRFVAAPDNERAASGLAKFYEQEGRLSDAEPYLLRVVREHPQSPQAHHNLGSLYARMDKPVEADAALQKATELMPRYQLAHQNLAMLRLRRMELEAGWAEYAWRSYRYKVEGAQPGWVPRTSALADDLSGQHVELRGEQGLGDELFFLRWLPELRRRGARVTYRVLTRKLTPIVETLNGLDAITHEPLPPGSSHIKLLAGDLPAALGGASARECPGPVPLRVHTARAAELRAQWLDPLGPRPKVGLAWRAGTQQDKFTGNTDLLLFKQCPLEPLLDLLAALDVSVVVLQRNPTPDELELMAQRLPHPFLDASDMDEKLDDTVALIAGLDCLVGVSNTNVHLAAGIGVHAEVLVPYPPDFRWPEVAQGSPWFPGYGVHRQTWSDGWTPALNSLQAALKARYRAV